MIPFLKFLAEANSNGSKFEKLIADNVNSWLKKNNLSQKFVASNYQTLDEDDGNRNEDYSDVLIEDKTTNKKFFIECKQNSRDNCVSTQFDINNDFTLQAVEGKNRQKIENNDIILKLQEDIQNNNEYQDFCKFLQTKTDLIKYIPADLYFNKIDINDKELNSLITKYNNLVKNDKTEADNKLFDKKLIRDTTRNVLNSIKYIKLSVKDEL